MAALTWRNVTGASAGNPASALAGASSAFTNASRGALNLVESNRKGEAIKNEQATQEAIASILASGRPLDGSQLGNFAPGVDTSKVLDAVQGYQINKSNLESAQVTNRLNEARAAGLEAENTPEAIARRNRLEEAQVNNVEEQLRIRRAELNRLNANDAEEARVREGQLAIERGTYSTDPDGLRGQAIASVNAGREAAMRRLFDTERQNPEFRNLPIGEQQNRIDKMYEENYDRFVEEETSRLAPEWFAQQQAKYGLTLDEASETTLGNRFQSVEAANTKAITEEQAAERTRQANLRKDAAKALTDGDMTSLIPSGNGYTLASSAAERRANNLTEAAAPKFIEQELNIQIDPDDTDEALAVLRSVGNNKAKFAEIMNQALTDRDRGWIPGDDDDVDWALAGSLAARYRADMRGELRNLSTAPEAANLNRLTFQELINKERVTSTPRQSAPAEEPEAAPVTAAQVIADRRAALQASKLQQNPIRPKL